MDRDRHQRSLESRALGKKSADVGASASALAGGRGTGRHLLSSQPPPYIAKPASSSSSEDADREHMGDDDQPSDVEGEQGHVSVDSSSSNGDEQGAVELTEDGTTVPQGRSKREAKKRKGSPKATGRQKQRSDCWKIFKVVTVPSKTKKGEIDTRAECRFCYKLMSYKQGGATSHLMRHIPKCTPYQNKEPRFMTVAKMKAQANLNFGPAMAGDTGLPLIATPREYDQDETRRIIAKMIIVHEYPFRMVEHTWFNVLMRYLNSSYQPIGRKTIRSECIKIYDSEREVLRKSLRSVSHISLTCDLWTSNQNLCYMSLVAHYIDKNWVMQCRVLNFIELDPPHSGDVIARAVFDCVAEWKLEDKIITLTLDNASSNTAAIRSLMVKFAARGSARFIDKYFHVRCGCHIVNLIVNDCLLPLAPLINKLRETVKYIKKSPSRMKEFLEICSSLALQNGPGLSLDVSTRWSSTYKMLSVCLAYKDALVDYADRDANYQWRPSGADWALYEKIAPILKSLAEVTSAFSGSTYPTTNIFYPYIVNVKVALRAAIASGDDELKLMADAMLDKFDKYWEEKNNVMVLATILDPRFKMRFIGWCFNQMYEPSKAANELRDVKDELKDLYSQFEMDHRHNKVASGGDVTSSSAMGTSSSLSSVTSQFQSFLRSTSTEPSKSELFIYLDEANESLHNKGFKLLEWWNLNAHRFPVVSKMAKNFLTVPASSVSSESTFSAGGRVLDDYRSSLRPAMVQYLVCASSWIRGVVDDMRPPIVVEKDDEDDVETILFPQNIVESN